MTITVHHLNHSRSQRILWLLEELGVPYDVEYYYRDPLMAPADLGKIHPLGKAPVITDGDKVIAESGAIVDYIVRRYGHGKLVPPVDSDAYDQYVEWLHYAEGSAMFPTLLKLFANLVLGEGGAPLAQVATGAADLQLSYVEATLGKRPYFAGSDFSAADVQMSFPLEFASAGGLCADKPNIQAYLAKLHARPAYQRALEKGGEYDLTKLFA